MKKSLFIPVWIKMLPVMEGKCIRDVSKIVDTTYSHTTKMVNELESRNILIKNMIGRKQKLSLTPSGYRCSLLCAELIQLINNKNRS